MNFGKMKFKMNNKGALPLWGIIAIIGVAVLVVSSPSIQNVFFERFTAGEQVFESKFVKPQWAKLECLPTDAYEGSYIKWIDQTNIFKCDGFTEECLFMLENTDTGWMRDDAVGRYKECDLNGQNCGNWNTYWVSASKELPKIKSGKSYVFDTGIFVVNEDHTKITMEWKPWKLYRHVGGATWVVNSYNCDIISSARANIRSEDSVIQLYRQGGEGTKWINYVNDWVYGPATNIFIHAQYGEVYCTAGQIFDIVELKMADGSLKLVDPQYSGTLENGEVLSGLGSKLTSVECCPNEPSCGSDFQYLPTPPVDKECFTDIQCYNAGGPVPIDETHYITYNCIDNKCVKSSPITVECTISSQCPAGQICDLSSTNYGKCILQPVGDYCGDGVCQVGETKINCPDDCGIPVDEENGIVISKATTITWGEFYSMDDDTFYETNYYCKSDSECPLEEGYDVSCVGIGDKLVSQLTERDMKVIKQRCDKGLGFLDELLNMAKGIFPGFAFLPDLCDGISEGWIGFKRALAGEGNYAGYCLAESTTWYGKLWETALKTVGGMGLPAQYVMIITLMILITLIGMGVRMFT